MSSCGTIPACDIRKDDKRTNIRCQHIPRLHSVARYKLFDDKAVLTLSTGGGQTDGTRMWTNRTSMSSSDGNVRRPRRVLPLANHVEYEPPTLLRLAKKTGQTDTDRRMTPDRYITFTAIRSQSKNAVAYTA